MKDENYINIGGWMVNRLGLKGNELLTYAIIYGFSQDDKSELKGGAQFIADTLCIRRATAIEIIAKLVEKGLVIKYPNPNRDGARYYYKAVTQSTETVHNTSVRKSCDECTETVQNVYGNRTQECTETVHSNKRGNKREIKGNTPREYLEAAIAEHPEFEYLRSAMDLWLEYKDSRREFYKTKVSLLSCIRNLDRYSGGSEDRAQEVVDQAIGNTWQGIYELKRRHNPDDDIPKGPKIFDWSAFKPAKPL